MVWKRDNPLKPTRLFSGVKVYFAVLVVILLATGNTGCLNGYSNIQVTSICVVPDNIRAREMDEKYVGTEYADSRVILLGVKDNRQALVVGKECENLLLGLKTRKENVEKKAKELNDRFEEKDFELWYNALTRGEFPSYSEYKNLEKQSKEIRDTMEKLESEWKGWHTLIYKGDVFTKLPDGSDLTAFASRYVNISKLIKVQ